MRVLLYPYCSHCHIPQSTCNLHCWNSSIEGWCEWYRQKQTIEDARSKKSVVMMNSGSRHLFGVLEINVNCFENSTEC